MHGSPILTPESPLNYFVRSFIFVNKQLTTDYSSLRSWRRLVRKRIGTDQVRVDICYITPDGRRLRTFPEIQKHLDLKSEKLTMEHFTFSKKVDLGETLDTEAVSVTTEGLGLKAGLWNFNLLCVGRVGGG